MTKLFYLFTSLYLFTSCSITERLIVLPNDEVKLAHDIDMSQLLLMGKSMGGEESLELSNIKKQDTIFSLKSYIEEKKDSIATLSIEEQTQLKALEKYHFKMLMDESQDQFVMTIFADFNSIDELNAMMSYDEVLNKTSVNPLNGKELPTEVPSNRLKTTYNYDGKVFKRQSVLKKNLLEENNFSNQEEFDPENPNLDMVLSMAKDLPIDMTYKLNYRFSKRIRSTSVKNAKISADRLMVDFEFDMKTYETDAEFLNLEIYFE